MSLRTVFMGTPELACVSLRTLLETPGFDVPAVVTQPDRPKGRDLKLAPPPVKQLAAERGLVVLQPERARAEEFLEQLRQLKPDLIAVAAYGQLLPPTLLAIPKFGCLNVHTSLLPQYRGAAPIQWAILNDDPETGVTIMKMDAGLDTGEILSQARTIIQETDDAHTLHDRLAQMGARLLADTIPDYTAGKIRGRPQPAEGISHARKIKKDDGLLNWARPAREIWNRVRGLIPWPGAFTLFPPHHTRLKIWRAEVVDVSGKPGDVITADRSGIIVGCGLQALRLLVLQREGGRKLEPGEFLAGCPLQAGQSLSQSA